MKNFFKQIGVDAVSAVGIFAVGSYFSPSTIGYVSWVILAIKVTACGIIVGAIVNYVFYREYMLKIVSMVMKRFK